MWSTSTLNQLESVKVQNIPSDRLREKPISCGNCFWWQDYFEYGLVSAFRGGRSCACLHCHATLAIIADTPRAQAPVEHIALGTNEAVDQRLVASTCGQDSDNCLPRVDPADTLPMSLPFDRCLQDKDLLEYFSSDEATRGVVTDFVLRNREQIIERFSLLPESDGGRLITNQLLARAIEQLLEETGFEDPIQAEVRREHLQLEKRILASLPDLDGEEFVFYWKLACGPDFRDSFYILLANEKVILAEEAYWEDYSIYLSVLRCIASKYGTRAKDFVPTKDWITFVNMFGDDISGPAVVEGARRRAFPGT